MGRGTVGMELPFTGLREMLLRIPPYALRPTPYALYAIIFSKLSFSTGSSIGTGYSPLKHAVQ